MAGAKKKPDKGGKDKGGGKKGGGKANAMLDGLPMAAMTRDQLEGHVIRLKNELDREREERNFIQLELERTQRLWEVATQSLDQERSVARLKDAEMAEAEEKHQLQMKVVQHKMKNLIGEHEDVIANLQVASQETLGVFQEANQREEKIIAEKLQAAREQMAETESRYLATIANLKVKQSRELQEARESLLQEAAALTKRQEQKLEDVTHQLELKRKTELEQMEAGKNKFLEEVMEKHQERVHELKEYYTEITEANRKEITLLKARIEEQASREGAVQRRIGAAEKEQANLRLQNQALQQQVEGSSRALQRSQNLEQNLKDTSNQDIPHHDFPHHDIPHHDIPHHDIPHHDIPHHDIPHHDIPHHDIPHHDIPHQDIPHHDIPHQDIPHHDIPHPGLSCHRNPDVERERDQLYEQLVGVVGEVRQRSEMRNLVLENKLEQLSGQLEKREAVLSEVLAATNMDPASVAQVTRQLENIIEEKNESISALRTEVATIRRLYTDLLDRPRGLPK
ncbi:Growth arrest-specific protein 8 [Trinorchestia longiramus]|nr:Growth arrest-specific protein 8 [Trinorchestia longiramus]